MTSPADTPLPYRFTVFTKPWNLPVPELGAKIAALGFQGIELPVRPGYAVHPENMAAELPRAARLLREEYGLIIESIAGPTTPDAIDACAASDVPVIRICPTLQKGESYNDGEARCQREWEALVPHLERTGITLGIQNHSGRCVPVNALGLTRLLAPFDPRHVAGVWDAAHEALEGTEPEMALDVIPAPYLRLVNLKNAYRRRTTGPEASDVTWRTYWTSGRQGFASWPRVAADLSRRGWRGVICLTAEYSDPDPATRDRLIAEDLAYARELFVPRILENS
jgi:sugar phosphate isomerase/epimerase